jgi:hypothetical protein
MNEQKAQPTLGRLRGSVDVEYEIDPDGRMGPWRRMAITVPITSSYGLSTSLTMTFDLPAGQAAAEGQTWGELVEQMGMSFQVGSDSYEEE